MVFQYHLEEMTIPLNCSGTQMWRKKCDGLSPFGLVPGFDVGPTISKLGTYVSVNLFVLLKC